MTDIIKAYERSGRGTGKESDRRSSVNNLHTDLLKIPSTLYLSQYKIIRSIQYLKIPIVSRLPTIVGSISKI